MIVKRSFARLHRQRAVNIIMRSGLFDREWYLQENPDIAALGIDPIRHYVVHGAREGRNPNRFFDSAWYLNSNPDVAASGMNPLVHYINHGHKEDRNPSPVFDASADKRANPDVAAAGIGPLAHYMFYGHAEGRQIERINVPEEQRQRLYSLLDLLPSLDELRVPRTFVDVIIPIYDGVAQTRRCVESVIASASRNTTIGRIILIDDCGPDPLMQQYLATLGAMPGVVLLANEENLGFVKSVNKGMTYAGSRDVVLLNSDTEVAGDWIDRLSAHAYSHPKVATVTPFSNNATICSYPSLPGHPDMQKEETVSSLDAAFRTANLGRTTELPTTVGFCMFIKRACLDEIGLFDDVTFGRGYGEESDFSLRSTSRGWRHLLAGDTFVYHTGETSFGSKSALAKREAGAIIRNRYPGYERAVTEFMMRDPPRPFRVAATAARWRRDSRPVILMLLHRLGGGTEKHVRDLGNKIGSRVRVLMLKVEAQSEFRIIGLGTDDYLDVSFQTNDLPQLAGFIRSFGVCRVHIHHFFGFEHIIHQFLSNLGLPYDLTIHDYILICPRIHLYRRSIGYCGEPEEVECLRCLQEDPPPLSPDIIWWRSEARQLIRTAERIICPSYDTAARISRYVPDANMIVVPHEDPSEFTTRHVVTPTLRANDVIRLAILGVIAEHKGAVFLLECVSAWYEANLNVDVTVIGEISVGSIIHDATTLASINQTGRYGNEEELRRLLAETDPHLLFYPQVSPETYSYVLSEGLRTALPLLAPDFGAFSERLKGQEWCWLYKPSDTPGIVTGLMRKIRTHIETGNAPVVQKSTASRCHSAHADFYPNAYLDWTKPVIW